MLGEAIKHYRNVHKMTQQELANLVSCSVDSVRRWEANTREPRASEIKEICKAFRCTESELLNGPVKQEFEVKILMGVKSLSNVAGFEISNNSFFFGIDDNEPQIHIGGKVVIGTQEEREKAAQKILKKFWEACWMYDHKGEAEAQMPDFTALQPA